MIKKIVNRILAIALIASIAVIGGATLFGNMRSLGYAFAVNYTQYLDKDGGPFAGISARIASLTAAINVNILGKDWFEKTNARMQLALGKHSLNFGSTTMVRLNTGHLYDLLGDADVSDDIESMKALNDTLGEDGIPMIFVYAHGTLYEDDMLPTGVADFNDKVADDMVNGMREAGITTIDSREVYKNRGMTLDDAIFRTDLHWSIMTAFNVYRASCEALLETGAIQPDMTATDIGRFDIEILENAHMGGMGERVGAEAVEPDDFQVITPAFETYIRQNIMTSEGYQQREGTFEQAVMNADLLEGGGYSNRYDSYGYHTEIVYYTNENAPEGRLLIVKDSYGTPVTSFMSLAVRDVCALDLRKTQKTVEQLVDEFKPDAVVVIHCQEMFRGKNYVFIN
ncbi:MAG: hypothetical protein Q4D04_12485 [Clostridia bacterium]|nr:hypothetical protein [Clostridia bacterium]